MEKMRKLAKHNSGCSFSEDIITEIFLWLPLKSLVRFKRLSKRWYFLITNKDSSFRFNYLSALSTRRGNRIVGSDDCHPIMPGFFYQCPEFLTRSYDRVRFLPTTSTHIPEGQGGINPLLSLDEWHDKFLSCCLCEDQDQKIFIAASSNGFLLCSLECSSPRTYYLVNPVTMEWVALPKLENIQRSFAHVGFVCKGDYPSLDLVEYTIVRVSWLDPCVNLLFNLFSSGDNQWREYSCSCQSLVPFTFPRHRNRVIVQGGGIVVYLLVMLRPSMATAILVFDLNKGKDNLLQMIETPGPDRGKSVIDCVDYIKEFDDGVIHYVRLCCSTDFEFWVLNTETRDWCLKLRVSFKTMMKGYLWTNVRKWNGPGVRQCNEAFSLYQIHAFHPMNPNLIFLTLYARMVCYNLQTGTLELVYDFSAQNMLMEYYQYVYEWPCWPPLL